jgi:hypothetical protein
VEEYVSANGVEAAFDDMVLPALIIARRDRMQGGLSAEGEEFALAATREIIASVEAKSNESAPAPAAVVEPTLDMLAAMLRRDGVQVEAKSARDLPSAVVERVEAVHPSAVFISVLPPGGLPQAAYLCRLLRKRFPALKIVVGWWGSDRDFDKLLVRMRKAGASYVTTSLRQSRSQLRHVADVPPAEVAAAAPASLAVGARP